MFKFIYRNRFIILGAVVGGTVLTAAYITGGAISVRDFLHVGEGKNVFVFIPQATKVSYETIMEYIKTNNLIADSQYYIIKDTNSLDVYTLVTVAK